MVTLVVGAVAIYIGIQLQSQSNVAPSPTAAANASCCENAGGLCDPSSGNGCGGFDINQACNSSHNWCWCVRTTNQCARDGTNNPEGTAEIFCGYGTGDGTACYTCPAGWTGNGNTICSGGQFMDCGNCNPPPPTTVPPEQCPSTQARFLVGGHGLVSSGTYQITEIPPFQYSVLINGDVNQRFQGNVSFSGPTGNANHSNGNTHDVPQPYQPGTYTLTASLSNGTVCDRASVTIAGVPTTVPPTSVPPTDTPTVTPTSTNTPTPTPTFITGSQCDAPCNPAAGDNACPQDHDCVESGGSYVCKLTACLNDPDSCLPNLCGPKPDCGEPCDPANGANACSEDHVCIDPEDDVVGYYECVIQFCADNPGICPDNNLCEIPDTALISDEADRMLIAMVLIFSGLLMYRLGIHYKIGQLLWDGSGDIAEDLTTRVDYYKKNKDDAEKRHQIEKFQKQMEKKIDDDEN